MSAKGQTIAAHPATGEAVLPDFRNLGVLLRILVGAELAKVLHLLISTQEVEIALRAAVESAATFEPVLLATLAVLVVSSGSLHRVRYWQGVAATMLVTVSVALLWVGVGMPYLGFTAPLWRPALVAITLAALMLIYFDWRRRTLSPALTEARLIALQARIRPHFLFNSLNTALGLIRSEPKRAESVLENLAELYRSLLAETGALVPLAKELELARGYGEIETMRLGPRLTINWQVQGAPLDALVPPLIIQPLLENAVYHGIEPSLTGGEVTVTLFLKGQQLSIVVRNPCQAQTVERQGNRMALTNIRERLALHFDAEAEMSAYAAGGEYVVQIRMPYKHD